MIHHWKGLDLKITGSENHHDPQPLGENILSQTLNLKHVEIIKVWIITKFDTILERSWLGDHSF